MTEYYTVKRIDNSRLLRPTAPARCGISGGGWRRARHRGAAAFYAWQHFECIQLRYQIEQLDAARRRRRS